MPPAHFPWLQRPSLAALTLLTCLRAAAADLAPLEGFIVAELQRTQVPACAVAVVIDGEIALAKGFGVASVDTGGAVTGDTLFRIGSTTKMFTAAGLVLLAEQGKLRLDAPIGEYVSGLQPAIARLTSHQLLTHTAGLADPNAMNGPPDESALGDRVRTLGSADLFDEPGRIYSYSNAGYWIAGYVAEVVGGRRYADHLQENLLRPLGLARSTFRPTVAMTWPLAVGHGPEGTGPASVIRPLADNAATWPAGQLFTSAREFARFCVAFLNGGQLEGRQVLSPRLITLLSAPHVPVPNDDRHYGYGLSRRTEAGLVWLSHSGSRAGYGSLVRLCPERKFAVVILCNRSGASLPRVADRAAELVLGLPPPSAPARAKLTMDAAEMARYAGRYSNGRHTLELRARNGRLVSAQGAEVTKVGATRFSRAASAGAPALEFELVTDPTGRVTHLISRGRAWKRME